MWTHPTNTHRLVEYVTQLRRVAQLDLRPTLPGHGRVITDHRALIQERIVLREERADRIREVLHDRTFNAYQIARVLLPDLDTVNRSSLSPRLLDTRIG